MERPRPGDGATTDELACKQLQHGQQQLAVAPLAVARVLALHFHSHAPLCGARHSLPVLERRAHLQRHSDQDEDADDDENAALAGEFHLRFRPRISCRTGRGAQSEDLLLYSKTQVRLVVDEVQCFVDPHAQRIGLRVEARAL